MPNKNKDKKIKISAKNIFKDRLFKKEPFQFGDIAVTKTEANKIAKNLQDKGHKIRIRPIKKEIDLYKSSIREAEYVIYKSKEKKAKKNSSKKD